MGVVSPLTINIAIAQPTRVPLTVIIAYQGTIYTFSEAGGTDLGSYVDQRFTQRCIRSTSALPNVTVFFRPDADGSREEVVFELGGIAGAGSPKSLGGYTTEIRRGPQLLASFTLPAHHYWSRWRWQSERRPVRTTVASLIASGMLPHYDGSVTPPGRTPATPTIAYSPMGLAGLVPDMAAAGDHPEIGLITETQADYVCNGRNLATVMAQAEASGTYPYHHRDEATGAPLDTTKWPRASINGAGAPNPWLPKNTALGINPDDAHMPSLCYLPFLLTGDPYYLEEMQFVTNFNILINPWNGRNSYNIPDAIRAYAWATRTAAETARVTPSVVPSWLLPQSYFQRHIDANRDAVTQYFITNRDPRLAQAYETYHTIEFFFGDDGAPGSPAPAKTYLQPYMEDYVALALAHVVQLFPDDAKWRAFYDYKIVNTLLRNNGTSGWVRAIASPYRLRVRNLPADPFLDWPGAWVLTQSALGLTYADPNVMPSPGGDLTYQALCLAVLTAATRLGVPGAAECQAWARPQVAAYAGSGNGIMSWKWAIS